MSHAAPLRLVVDAASRSAPATPSPSGRFSRWASVSAVFAAAALIVLAGLHIGEEERALRRLPAQARTALYQRTIENLTSVCAGEGRGALRDFCRDQAKLALMFPDCDRTCASAVREELRNPTR